MKAIELLIDLQRHQHSPAAQALVQSEREEMQLYEKYQAYYSYGFYLAQKL